MKGGNFFAELKRRNVYKVAVAYAVVSWLLIQAASILLPTFEAPPWVMKVLVLVIVLGFPAALNLFLGVRDYAGGNQAGIGSCA
jgi:adenylate cyclase